MSKFITHEELTFIVQKRTTDKEFNPDRDGGDCSSGCKFFAPLEGELGYNWGVCCNRISPRASLLTFEHMGCSYFEWDGEEHEHGK